MKYDEFIEEISKKECILRLKAILSEVASDENAVCYVTNYDKGALETAIRAVEEVQQYRELEERLNGISVKQVVDGFIATVEKQTQEDYKCGRILTNKEANEWESFLKSKTGRK